MLFATLAVVPVDFGSGAAGLRAHHWPSSCGGEGQKPCKIWQHVPSCKPGLVEVALTRCKKDEGIIKNVRDDAVALVNPNADPSCGGLGQQACVTSCDDNLMLSVDGGDCIHNRATIARMARSAAGEVGPVLEMIGRTILDCGVETIVRGLDARNSAQAEDAAQRMIERNCIRVALEEAQNADYNTVTIGYGGGGSLLIGGEAEGGIAYDVGFNRMPSSYGVIGVNMGLQAGASPTSLIVSVYKGINQPGQDTFGGDGHGFAWEGRYAVGGGMAVWFNYDGDFTGASIAIGSGLEFQAAYVRNTTKIYSPLQVAWDQYRDSRRPVAVVEQPTYRRPAHRPSPRPQPAPRPGQPQIDPETQRQIDRDYAIADAADAIAAGLNAAMARQQEERALRTAELERISWIELCNKAKVDGRKVKRLDVAYAYWADASRGGEEGWMSTSWVMLDKGKCETVELPSDPDGYGMEYTVMVFANSEEPRRHWGGDELQFCVKRKGGKLRSADQRSCDRGSDEFLVRGFALEMEPGGRRLEFESSGKTGRGYLN